MTDNNHYIIKYEKNSGIRLICLRHKQFLQYLLGHTNCIYAYDLKTLFSNFFRYYENYKKNNKQNMFFIGIDEENNKALLNTAVSMKLTVEEMMIEIEKLYELTLERNPELFI